MDLWLVVGRLFGELRKSQTINYTNGWMWAPHIQQARSSAVTNGGMIGYAYYEGTKEMDMNIWRCDNKDNKRRKAKKTPKESAGFSPQVE